MAEVDQRRISNQPSEFADARTAARLLDVKLKTLYAYVSRGLVRSVDAPKGRARHYAIEDLRRLKSRSDARRGHTAVAASALDWGPPVLDSAITRIDPRGPHYRGQCAIDLARANTPFERVMQLLWQAEVAQPTSSAVARAQRRALTQLSEALPEQPVDPFTQLEVFVSLCSVHDAEKFSRSSELELQRGSSLLSNMARALAKPFTTTARAAADEPIARLLCQAFGIGTGARQVALIDQMLVLCADHELNVSTFAVRVTASGGANLYACVSAGLCALSGWKHGAVCDRVEAFAALCGRSRDLKGVLRERARLGDWVPGFGQPLYPAGDPRGTFLLAAARRLSAGPNARGRRRFSRSKRPCAGWVTRTPPWTWACAQRAQRSACRSERQARSSRWVAAPAS
jgi:citrate synthase